jgi:threonine/homoserine/homoserine lactone efflux protein
MSAGPAYAILRVGGAFYLVVLGVAGLSTGIGSRRPPGRHRDSGSRQAGVSARARSAFAAGVLSDLLNPKIGLFYVALLPQFLPAGQPVLGWSLLLSAIDVAVALSWLLLLAWAADTALRWLRRPRVDLWLQRGFSASLIGIGAVMSLSL